MSETDNPSAEPESPADSLYRALRDAFVHLPEALTSGELHLPGTQAEVDYLVASLPAAMDSGDMLAVLRVVLPLACYTDNRNLSVPSRQIAELLRAAGYAGLPEERETEVSREKDGITALCRAMIGELQQLLARGTSIAKGCINYIRDLVPEVDDQPAAE